MKRKFTQMIMLMCAMMCTSVVVKAQSTNLSKTAKSLEAKFAKMPQHRAAQRRATEGTDYALLDSVISDTHRAHYRYNEYGWLVSEKHYKWNDTGNENSGMMFDTEESYLLEYDFDDLGRCTRYSKYKYNADESKGVETERIVSVWTSEREHHEKYYSLTDFYHDFEELTLVEEMAYDKFGNPCLNKSYSWNSETERMELTDFVELKFTGCAVVLKYDETNTNYEIDFDYALMQLYCEYNVNFRKNDGLNAFKLETETDGLTTTKTRYVIEFSYDDEYDLSKLDSYWELAEKEVITLTPSRNRYASAFYYDRGDAIDMPSDEHDNYSSSTRAGSEMVLDASYIFEWDEYERLVKLVCTDSYGDVKTYTCSYANNKYNEIDLIEFEKSWINHWEYSEGTCVKGSFYGEVKEENTDYTYNNYYKETAAPAILRSYELQEGDNHIYFEEDGWCYEGFKVAEWVWNEATKTEELQVTCGEMLVRRTENSNGRYVPDNPAYNYEFPVGMYFPHIEKMDENVNRDKAIIYLKWDIEEGGWNVARDGNDVATVISHYTNEKGQIINETITYLFDTKSERMVALPDLNQTIFSFDALNRLSTIENSDFTVHYVYLNDDCNYLKESYSIDKATGNKYDICKYYYSAGKYIPPYTDIEEVKTAGKAWSINGTSVIADGDIVLYTVNGQIVARGNGAVVAPQNGIYIVDVNGTRTKILIR